MDRPRSAPPSFPLSEHEPDTAFRPWFAHYTPGVPQHLEYRKGPLYAWLDQAAEQVPERTACAFASTGISYARLRRDAEVIAANLRRHGVQPGDRVGIMMPNLPQTVQAFWGALKAGAVVVMVNPLYMEKELTHQLRDAGVRHLLTVDLCWPKLEPLRDRLGVEKFFVTTPAESLRAPVRLLYRLKKAWKKEARPRVPFDAQNVLPFNDLLRGRERLSVPVADPENTIALLQYTGGTTGVSKGVMLSHFNLGANTQQTAAFLPSLHKKTQVIMGVLPLFHVYGLSTCLLLPTILQATLVTVPRYVPGELLAAIEKHRGTLLPGAPAIYISLLQQKNISKYRLESLELCISGSAPMPVEYLRQFEQTFKATMIEGYGLTECSPITHLNPETGQRAGYIGLPLPDTEARIVDMEVGDVPLPPGKVGELIIRGPQAMSGYWNAPDATANTLRNGWVYTGDIAAMDEDGYFNIVDRKKDMIIVGGYNVSPREVDEVLYEHPAVSEAVTAGVPHPSRGEVIKAYVVLKPGARLTKTELTGWCRDRLANYKVPRQVEFRDALPKTQVGKVLRRTLREEEIERQRSGPAAREKRRAPEGEA